MNIRTLSMKELSDKLNKKEISAKEVCEEYLEAAEKN
jgi:Asp-tRNA(Asn)/Glu-tRNA(Gln) amidotransferase A subunit family amidase